MKKKKLHNRLKRRRAAPSHIFILVSFASFTACILFVASFFVVKNQNQQKVLGLLTDNYNPNKNQGNQENQPSPTVPPLPTSTPFQLQPTQTPFQQRPTSSPIPTIPPYISPTPPPLPTFPGGFIPYQPSSSDYNQYIQNLLNSQFSSSPDNCSAKDSLGNTVIVENGQQCPGTPYLCSNGSCTGQCTSNPNGCFNGAENCINGLCGAGNNPPQQQPSPTPTSTVAPGMPSPTPGQTSQTQQTQQTTQQTQQQTTQQTQSQQPQNYGSYNTAPQNGVPVPQQQQSQSFFQTIIQTIPFFRQSTTPTTQQNTTPSGPLFQGSAALTGGQISQEIKVQITIQNGKLVVIATRADGASITLSDEVTQRLIDLMALGNFPSLQAYSSNAFIIKQGNTDAVTNLPTSINLPFGTISVSTPNGDQQLALSTDQAVDAALSTATLTNVDTRQSFWDYVLHGPSSKPFDRVISIKTLSNGDASYAVTGTVKKRFIASFPIDIKRTVYISPTTGRVQQITEDPIASFLDKISVVYNPIP